ncbi:MAG: fibronectin type III domain-containing protein, partial [Patescibacteria group bacterium]
PISSSTINLSWSASSDNTAVTGYKIYRNSTQIATSPTTTYSNTALTPSSTYSYTVSAYDAAGNVSVQSAAQSATTQTSSEVILIPTIPLIPTSDTTPPTTPTNLTATAPSTSQINLSWNASTDNTAVMGYKIYRNGIHITTSLTPSYSNMNLAPSTSYTYSVAAYDAAGNVSPQTAGVSGATPATMPILPVLLPQLPLVPEVPTLPILPTNIPLTTTPLPFTRPLYRGIRSTEVKNLQTFLIQHNYLAPSNDTGLYGPLTRQAVQKYQCDHNIVCSGNEFSTGYGVVGQQTLAKLNTTSTTTTPPAPSSAAKTNLTPAQADAIIALIQAFGAEAEVVARVKGVLGR